MHDHHQTLTQKSCYHIAQDGTGDFTTISQALEALAQMDKAPVCPSQAPAPAGTAPDLRQSGGSFRPVRDSTSSTARRSSSFSSERSMPFSCCSIVFPRFHKKSLTVWYCTPPAEKCKRGAGRAGPERFRVRPRRILTRGCRPGTPPRKLSEAPRRPDIGKGSFEKSSARFLPTARGIPDIFHADGKCPF